MGWRTWLSVITMLFQKLVDSFSKVLGLLSHGVAVALMHYVKAVSLLVVVQFGPLAALFSLLPGPFKRSFSVWSKSYVNITCWTITLNIFWVLSKTFSTASLIKAGGIGAPFGETLGYTCLSIVLFVAIFLTPTWTSKFIGGVLVPNMTTGLSLAAGKVGKLAQLSKR